VARFGKKLKVEWSNSQLIPTLLLSIYSGRWAEWRGGSGLWITGAADKAASLMGCKSPAVNCPIQTASISGTRGGNEPWGARK
jgi:hypothetical protein